MLARIYQGAEKGAYFSENKHGNMTFLKEIYNQEAVLMWKIPTAKTDTDSWDWDVSHVEYSQLEAGFMEV